MEVDLDSSPNAVDSQGSQTSSASASSLAVQFSAEDVQENNDSNFPKSAESEMIDGKTRRLNRRLALAKLQLPTLAMKSDIIIDLTADENKEDDVEWLKKKFPFIEADHAKATSSLATGNDLHCVASQKTLKKLLEKKLAEKRMAGLVKRKELYMKDNEDIFNGEEDDEVEEFSRSRGDFKPEEVKDNEEDEDYSGDDEDEEESNECVPKNSLEPESENNITNSHSFPVLENSLDSAPVIVNAAEHNCDAKDDDYDSNIGMTQPVFPSSLSQWFDDGSTQESTELIRPTARVPEFVNIGTFSDMDPFKNDNEDDILMFCSGQFDNQDFPRPVDDRAENDAELSDTHCDVIEVKSTQKRKRLVESDEEDSDTVAGSHEIPEQLHRDMDSLTDMLNDEPKAEVTALRRTLIPESDSDSEVSIESIGEDSLSGKQSSEEEEDEAAEKGNNSECGDEANSDDEVAVVRRLERNNSEWKDNRSKWFDDEASLSGDDVGSDQDEDIDIPNEYEPEEGDADIVPDSEILRRQNHRLLMKQESDRDHQELVKLQERLLVDGELDSTETDRTFRLKLRTDVDVQEVVNEEEDTLNDEKDVVDFRSSESRVSAIKWFMKHKQDYEKANDGEDENDLIAVAANSLPVANYVSDGLCRAPRSLLGQSNLKNAIKEIPAINGAKQLYVNNAVLDVQKRPSSPTLQEAKKRRTNFSVLSVLDQP